MISSISMTYFKNHTDSRYEFIPGINAIVGPGGCGKTSIMEAIGWGVFGSLPGKKSSFEQVGYKDVGQIEVWFGQHYVFKSFSGYSLLDIETEDRTIANGEMSVRESVEDILGGKRLADLFSGLIGVTQGSIDSFFSGSDSERTKHFSKIIGIDEYKKCADWLIGAWHEIETKRKVVTETISEMERGEKSYYETCQEFEMYCAELSDLELTLVPEAEMRVFGVSQAKKGLKSTLGHVAEMEAEIKRVDARLDTSEMDRALNSIAGNFCPECGTLVSGTKMASIKEKYQAKFDETAALLELKSSILSKIAIEKHLIVQAGSSMEELEDRVSVETEKLSELMRQRDTLKGRISAMEPLVVEGLTRKLASSWEQLKGILDTKTKLETIRSVCRKVPVIVSESTTMEVSILATYFVKMIYPDWEVDWMRDFSITVTIGDMELPFTSLSKSQKAIASLSVILALAKAISPVDFILLDEPFSNMDASQVALVATAIRATGWFNQVILTTHRSEVEHIFDNVIEVSV